MSINELQVAREQIWDAITEVYCNQGMKSMDFPLPTDNPQERELIRQALEYWQNEYCIKINSFRFNVCDLEIKHKGIKRIEKWVSDKLTKKIDETKEIVFSVSQQAYEHFQQAKKQLENASNERARKDAVRDCASAMEAIIKEFGKVNDIQDAYKKLRDAKVWGKDEIVKDGYAMFNTLHRLYPDL